MTRITLFAGIALFLSAAVLSAQNVDLKPVLQTETKYVFTLKKSHGGSDGFKELMPHLSRQVIVLETGPANDAGMKVTLLVDRPTNMDDNKMPTLSAPVREWTIAFTLTEAGAITGITSQSSDGEVPENIARSVAASLLRELLFMPQFALGPALDRHPIILSRSSGQGGVVSVTYELPANTVEKTPDGIESTVTTAGGTAVYDPATSFFTQRKHVESSKMFMPVDPSGGEQRVVTMLVTTSYSVTISKKGG